MKTSSTSSHPTATWPWGVFSGVGVHQYPHEDDGARHGHRHADHGPRLDRQAEGREHGDAEEGCDQTLADGARDGHGLDGQQVLQVEMQADAEHEQDDAHLGELMGQVDIANEAGGVRPDEDAGQEIAHDREAQPLGQQPQQPGGGERGGDGGDEREVVHASSSASASGDF